MGLSGTLAPGEHLFITGEHAVDWESANSFPAVGLSLNNSGDTVSLFQVAGGATTLVESYDYTSSDTDVSVGRLPDATGAFAAFDALAEGGAGPQPTPGGANGGIATPKILSWTVEPAFPTSADAILVRALAADADGIAECVLRWSLNGAAQPDVGLVRVDGTDARGNWETTIAPLAAGTTLGVVVRVSDGTLLAETNEAVLSIAGAGSPVVLNEILADPPPDPNGDANGDGVRGTADDEFVELFNGGPDPVDLEGWSLHDATGLRHTFAAGAILAPGGFYVVFGGGTPTGIPSDAVVASTGGLSLNNTADEVRLVGADDVTRDFHAYGAEANGDESLIRVPDGGEWTRPSEAGHTWAYSPGLSNGGTSSVEPESWARIKALYRP
jgi:hypothetical protein